MTSRQRNGQSRAGKPAIPGPRGTPQLVTPEGDPLVFASAWYLHTGLDDVRQRLKAAGDFGWDEGVRTGPGGSFEMTWIEVNPGAAIQAASLDQRILAMLTLTASKLVVHTLSRERLEACRLRLEEFLDDRIRLLGTEFKTAEDVLREPGREPEPEPFVPPPEVVAELEERMLRQWIDDAIPALGGLTPREAVKTPEGRQRVLELIEYITRDQERVRHAPGLFSPNYRKTRKMLGLE
jgi:hypothetical protein